MSKVYEPKSIIFRGEIFLSLKLDVIVEPYKKDPPFGTCLGLNKVRVPHSVIAKFMICYLSFSV